MNRTLITALTFLKRTFPKRYLRNAPFGVSYQDVTLRHQAASDLIKSKLLDDKPVMICRLGWVELTCVLTYYFGQQQTSLLRKSIAYIKGDTTPFWWDDHIITSMCNNAGFFPPATESLAQFSQLMLEDMTQADVLGSWLKEEQLLDQYLHKVVKVRLPDLEPYYHLNPWTEALAGKTILVIHPFAESITQQYANRAHLFADNRMLPAFDLKTIKAVQSIANNKTEFATWFDAYGHMCSQVSQTDFDIAIIGCGAYGFPLAAHVKRLGKKAVHLGGVTQILFGIRGKRWEQHEFIAQLINEHWVRPAQTEIPVDFEKVEDGCYW